MSGFALQLKKAGALVIFSLFPLVILAIDLFSFLSEVLGALLSNGVVVNDFMVAPPLGTFTVHVSQIAKLLSSTTVKNFLPNSPAAVCN